MKIINNVDETLRDDLSVEIKAGSKVSIAAACFSIYAFQELKEEHALLLEENRRLLSLAEDGCDDEQLRLLARQRLGLVMPGEIIFYFEK